MPPSVARVGSLRFAGFASAARSTPLREGMARPSAARGWQGGWQVPSAELTLSGFPADLRESEYRTSLVRPTSGRKS